MLKEEIMSILKMEDILNKYGIKLNKNMYSCPFHKDNSPSAKAYYKTFYCFGCGKRRRFNTICSVLF